MVAFCILDQYQQTASHAKCSIDNCHRMHTRYKDTQTQTPHLHDETLILLIHEYLQLHGSQYKQKPHLSHPLHKHTTYFNTPRLKKTLSLTTAATQQTSHIHPHSYYNIHKKNMSHTHTFIVTRHLATRGNHKILLTSPPHISSSEKILPRLTRLSFAQLRKKLITLPQIIFTQCRHQNTSITNMPLL